MPTVGAGFHARPASVNGKRRAPVKNGARAVPAGSNTWGGGRKVGATWETQALSVTPNGCNQPTPAVTRRRGVEDAAPYGRVLNVSVRIVVNRCVNAANLHPALGSPERGAVAALCAVTEGLVQRGCGMTTLPVIPRRGGRGGGARGTDVAGHPTGGAPRTVRPTTYGKVSA